MLSLAAIAPIWGYSRVSWLQLGERPSAMEAAGMALIIAALAVLAAYGVLAGRRVAGAPGENVTLPPFID